MLKVKVYVYGPDIPSRFSGLHINYVQVLELTLSQSHLLGECATISAAVEMQTVPIFILPSTHYCWVDRGDVYSKLAQGFYT